MNHLYKTGQVRWYQRPKKDRIYVIALDPSLGTGGDPAAIQVFEAKPLSKWPNGDTTGPPYLNRYVSWPHSATTYMKLCRIHKHLFQHRKQHHWRSCLDQHSRIRRRKHHKAISSASPAVVEAADIAKDSTPPTSPSWQPATSSKS
jgi:hypothetical protein